MFNFRPYRIKILRWLGTVMIICLLFNTEIYAHTSLEEKTILKKAKKFEKMAYKAYHRGKYDAAKKNIQKSISIIKKAPKKYDFQLSSRYSSMAGLYSDMKDYKSAMTYYQKCIDGCKKSGEIVSCYSNLANLYIVLNDYDKALYYQKKSLKNCIKEGKLCKMAVPHEYFSIGETYEIIGNTTEAIKFYEKSLKIFQKDYGEEHINTIKVMNHLEKLYLKTNNTKKSSEYLNKSMKLMEKTIHKKDTGELGVLLFEYGRIAEQLRSEGENTKALQYHEKQLEILKVIPQFKTTLLATIYNNIGIIYMDNAEYQKSLDYLLKALSLNRNSKIFGKFNKDTIILYQNIVYIYQMLGKNQQALNYNKKAIEACKKGIGEYHTNCSTTYIYMVYLYLIMQDYENMYQTAMMVYDSFLLNRDQIFSIMDKKHKEDYLQKNRFSIQLILNVAYRYIYELKKVKHTKKVQSVLHSGANAWLNYKGSIFDSENAIAMLYASTKDKKLEAKIKDLVSSKRHLAKLYQSLPKPKERETWKNNIKKTEEKIALLSNQISSKSASFKEHQGLKSITYKDITSHLEEDELYIDYAKTGENYYLFTLDKKENITFIQLDKNRTKEIDNLVKTFRGDINTILTGKNLTDEKLKRITESSKEKLSKLYELVIKQPLHDTIEGKKSLIISPDGALRLLPFETLYNKEKGKYFIEEKEIRYIPSGKELIRLYKYASNKKSKKNSTVIFADPAFNTKIASASKEETNITPNTSRAGIIKSLFRMHFSPLPGTNKEAAEIKNILKGTKVEEYEKKEATEAALLKTKGPKILHIATHGFFINDNTIPNPMLKSGIALAGANTSAIKGKSDGIVTALKLSGLDLKGTDLVVLSACQTGVVDINSTDSVSGLSKAFIQAGAKDIVISLWSVDDQATQELMTSFYREMKKNKNYAKALKAAKLKMIEEGRHPFYWGAFVVSGL